MSKIRLVAVAAALALALAFGASHATAHTASADCGQPCMHAQSDFPRDRDRDPRFTTNFCWWCFAQPVYYPVYYTYFPTFQYYQYPFYCSTIYRIWGYC